MKNKFLILCAILFSTGITLKAQKSDKDDDYSPTFGIKAGLNFSNVWDAEGQDFVAETKAGFVTGLFLGIPVGKYLGFQPEILVSQKGFRGSGTLLGSEYSFKRTTTYIDVPLQLQVRPASFLTVVLGPQVSYLIHQKSVYTFGSTSTVQEQAFNNDNIRKNILGFVAGGDINISHLVISGRAGWDLLTNNGDGSTGTPRYKNRWVQLTLGFKI